MITKMSLQKFPSLESIIFTIDNKPSIKLLSFSSSYTEQMSLINLNILILENINIHFEKSKLKYRKIFTFLDVSSFTINAILLSCISVLSFFSEKFISLICILSAVSIILNVIISSLIKDKLFKSKYKSQRKKCYTIDQYLNIFYLTRFKILEDKIITNDEIKLFNFFLTKIRSKL